MDLVTSLSKAKSEGVSVHAVAAHYDHIPTRTDLPWMNTFPVIKLTSSREVRLSAMVAPDYDGDATALYIPAMVLHHAVKS